MVAHTGPGTGRSHISSRLPAWLFALVLFTIGVVSASCFLLSRLGKTVAGSVALPHAHTPAAQHLTPVRLPDLQPALDRALAPLLRSGVLSPQQGGGMVIGVLDHGQRRIYAHGAARPDSIFEIGSITKTFTGLALAQMVEQSRVTLDEPVRMLLPAPALPQPPGAEITLLDLATQHSGLPRLPGNLHPRNSADGYAPADADGPYADYDDADLMRYLGQHGLQRPQQPAFLYSNLGFGLLGLALATRAGTSYSELVRAQITGPLGLSDTVTTLSPQQRQRLVAGYTPAGDPTPAWEMGALAGAGALKSTAADLLRYCEANLHPEQISAGAAPGTPAATFAPAVALDHELLADGPANLKIALAWFFDPKSGTFNHNGGTGGYTARVSFSPPLDRAVVVLYNRADLEGQPAFVDRVTSLVAALLDGAPAPALQ